MCDKCGHLMVESETFEEHFGRLARQHEGKFALVRGTEIVGVFPSPDAADDAGVQAFGADAEFLIRRIGA